jgi:predicted lipoprotein with Yx(FWY)xxD motif
MRIRTLRPIDFRFWLSALLLPLAFLVLGARVTPTVQAQAVSALTVKQDPGLGSILADGQGMTLYTFAQDSAGTSVCNTSCAGIWPPFAPPIGDFTLPSGLGGTLGVITRSDGSEQVTYNGMPLYYFAQDMDSGDAYGQGVAGFSVVLPH